MNIPLTPESPVPAASTAGSPAPPYRIEPFLLDGRHGPLFCLSLAPTNEPIRATVLYLHPFAEEMHKSRRMVALQARHLAGAGYAVLQVDLSGCGDSWGDFGEARWEIWLDDAASALTWLGERWPDAKILTWGLRLGATLAIALAEPCPHIQGAVLWQPVIDGERFLNQFLRIRLASEMLTAGRTQGGTRRLREQLNRGEAVEVGGYLLDPGLTAALTPLRLDRMTPPRRVGWVEIVPDSTAPTSATQQAVLEAWRRRDYDVTVTTVVCEPFWNAQEPAECPPLLDATLASMERIHS